MIRAASILAALASVAAILAHIATDAAPRLAADLARFHQERALK
jgi:hypothetical protein